MSSASIGLSSYDFARLSRAITTLTQFALRLKVLGNSIKLKADRGPTEAWDAQAGEALTKQDEPA
jgi:hypothetical protein